MTKYIRYRAGDGACYGMVDGDTVRELRGDLFEHAENGVTHRLGDLKLLFPCTPSKILAVGLNYKSHLGARPAPANPEIFYKPASCLQDPEGPIVIPSDAANVHYEGELVIVLGRRVHRASREEASAAIFGVTCGNDVSERDWQHGANKDLQWWRAKGCDTFGPLGPAMVTGLDSSNLLLQTRLNGEVVQKQSTSDLMFDGPAIVSYISQWVTLEHGRRDLHWDSGQHEEDERRAISVEVEIEGIGILRNKVVS